MKKITHTVYSRGAGGVSGVEIISTEKEGKSGKVGRIGLRFFETGKKGFFLMEPVEAFKLGCFIEEAAISVSAGTPLKKKLPPHAAKKDDAVKAGVTVDGWARNGKGGCSLQYCKGDQMFNIGLGGAEESKFVAAFLKHLSVESSWLIGTYDAAAEGDNVGASAEDEPAGDSENVAALKNLIKQKKADAKAMLDYFKVSTLEELAASDNYFKAIKMLEAKK